MDIVNQSPKDPDFIQNPYPFYKKMREQGGVKYWMDYEKVAVFDYKTVSAILKNPRFGRENKSYGSKKVPKHMQAFYDVENHSLLEMEPPRHTRLRGLLVRRFAPRQIEALANDIKFLCHQLIDQFCGPTVNLLPAYATKLPVIVIARLLGIPDNMSDKLLKWSNNMVMMYQVNRSRSVEEKASQSSLEFVDFLRSYIEVRRRQPANDLITHLIRAEENGGQLETQEMISTCILLLNAGHEATVHTLGNGIKCLLENSFDRSLLGVSDVAVNIVEEILRYDPPLHMFTRYAYESCQLGPFEIKAGQEVALILGSTGRDQAIWCKPDRFDPTRAFVKNKSFGGGIHFCIGAPLARLELRIALSVLFSRFPNLKITKLPSYANIYHFHGLNDLQVTL